MDSRVAKGVVFITLFIVLSNFGLLFVSTDEPQAQSLLSADTNNMDQSNHERHERSLLKPTIGHEQEDFDDYGSGEEVTLLPNSEEIDEDTIRPKEDFTTHTFKEPTTSHQGDLTSHPSVETATHPSDLESSTTEKTTTNSQEDPTSQLSVEPTTHLLEDVINRTSKEPSTLPHEDPTFRPSTEPTTHPKEDHTYPPFEGFNDSYPVPEGFQKFEFVNTYITRGSCDEYRNFGFSQSGVYHMKVPRFGEFFALCLMEKNETWTVLQRRSGAKTQFWNRSFEDYSHGFGNPSSDHWLGLEKVSNYVKRGHRLILRIALYHDLCQDKYKCSRMDPNGYWWADWEFKIGDRAQNYKLTVSKVINGNLTDALKDPLKINNDQMFSTVDSNNGKHKERNCAKYRQFGGWWHKDCSLVALNGVYNLNSKQYGMHWTYQGLSAKGKNKNTILTYTIKPKYSLMMFRFK